MPGLKITLLQQPLVWMDGPANLRHFDRQLETITGRDVIVLPEMITTGFAMEAAQQSLPQAEVVAWMHDKARQTNALVAGSAALQSERGPVNRFLLVEPDGTLTLGFWGRGGEHVEKGGRLEQPQLRPLHRIPRRLVVLGKKRLPSVRPILVRGIDKRLVARVVRVLLHLVVDSPHKVVNMPARRAHDDDVRGRVD